ncbi:MAG TPA: hypothetical protein VM735_05915, partial [Candidatus Kapabacteria bacterium]|nr:hypothetical protein [Candidatus Kapabacteria bacterium]
MISVNLVYTFPLVLDRQPLARLDKLFQTISFQPDTASGPSRTTPGITNASIRSCGLVQVKVRSRVFFAGVTV